MNLPVPNFDCEGSLLFVRRGAIKLLYTSILTRVLIGVVVDFFTIARVFVSILKFSSIYVH